MARFGLLGKNISYSYSKPFFENFFNENKLPHQYTNFDIKTIDGLASVLNENKNLKGFNVTIPFKEAILPYLDEIDPIAQEIGAVNVVKITANKKLIGYNTDCYGFEKSLFQKFSQLDKTALILGTGGASKAIAFVLKNNNFHFSEVSRTKNKTHLTYEKLTKSLILKHQLIINCTPLGTSPNLTQYPQIPYSFLTSNHILFDLIYNPKMTTFLKLGKEQGAQILNGEKMLYYQALKSWEIWND